MRLILKWCKWFLILPLFLLSSLEGSEEQAGTVVTINVRPGAETSSDSNDGATRATALATIGEALKRAKEHLAKDESVDICLFPGVYPGFTLDMEVPPESPETRLRIYSSIANRISFSGGERITAVNVNERDRKIVDIRSDGAWDFFVLDERTLVLPKEKASGYIHFRPHKGNYQVLFDQIISKETFSTYGVKIDDTQGSAGIHIRGVPVIIEGIAFRAFPQETAVLIEDASVTMKDVQFELNAGHGLKLNGGRVASMEKVTFRLNGFTGFTANDFDALTTTASTSEFNGWRLPYGDGLTAANVVERVNLVIHRGLRVSENRSPGSALLIRNSQGVEISRAFIAANERGGLELVNIPNGALITDGEFVSNRGSALIIENTAAIYAGNIVYGPPRGTGEALVSVKGDSDSVQTWQKNILAQDHKTAPIFSVTPDPQLPFHNSQNLYFAVNKAGAFSLRRGSQPLEVGFEKWQEITESDLDSFFGSPLFLNPTKFNFALAPDSPWFNSSQWPVRELQEQAP